MECIDYQQSESIIKNVIGYHLDKNEKEIYYIHYSDLEEIVKDLIDCHNDKIEYWQKLYENRVKNMIEKEIIVHEPLIVDGFACIQFKDTKIVNIQKIDWDVIDTNEEKENFIKTILMEYLKYKNINKEDLIYRKDYEQFLSCDKNIKFKKINMWNIIKKIASELGINVKY